MSGPLILPDYEILKLKAYIAQRELKNIYITVGKAFKPTNESSNI